MNKELTEQTMKLTKAYISSLDFTLDTLISIRDSLKKLNEAYENNVHQSKN